MTLSLNDTCDQLVITSDYQDPANQSVTLTVTANCTTTYDAIEVSVDDASYTLTPDSLSLTDFVVGVYTIQLVTIQEDGTSITELKCILIDCDLNCTMLDTFLDLTDNEENLVKALSYHALSAIADCDTCTCSDWCTLYNTATNQTCVTNAEPCGCS